MPESINWLPKPKVRPAQEFSKRGRSFAESPVEVGIRITEAADFDKKYNGFLVGRALVFIRNQPQGLMMRPGVIRWEFDRVREHTIKGFISLDNMIPKQIDRMNVDGIHAYPDHPVPTNLIAELDSRMSTLINRNYRALRDQFMSDSHNRKPGKW